MTLKVERHSLMSSIDGSYLNYKYMTLLLILFVRRIFVGYLSGLPSVDIFTFSTLCHALTFGILLSLVKVICP